jgi:hypothetical protein
MTLSVTSLRGPMQPLSTTALAERDAVLQLCRIYALALDTRDEAMLRSIFAPHATARGWRGEFAIADYLTDLLGAVKTYHATMHTILNQYAVVDGDAANAWSYGVAYHIHPPGSGIEDLVVGIHYRDQVARSAKGWWIVRRDVAAIWSRGPLPPGAPRKP